MQISFIFLPHSFLFSTLVRFHFVSFFYFLFLFVFVSFRLSSSSPFHPFILNLSLCSLFSIVSFSFLSFPDLIHLLSSFCSSILSLFLPLNSLLVCLSFLFLSFSFSPQPVIPYLLLYFFPFSFLSLSSFSPFPQLYPYFISLACSSAELSLCIQINSPHIAIIAANATACFMALCRLSCNKRLHSKSARGSVK